MKRIGIVALLIVGLSVLALVQHGSAGDKNAPVSLTDAQFTKMVVDDAKAMQEPLSKDIVSGKTGRKVVTAALMIQAYSELSKHPDAKVASANARLVLGYLSGGDIAEARKAAAHLYPKIVSGKGEASKDGGKETKKVITTSK